MDVTLLHFAWNEREGDKKLIKSVECLQDDKAKANGLEEDGNNAQACHLSLSLFLEHAIH